MKRLTAIVAALLLSAPVSASAQGLLRGYANSQAAREGQAAAPQRQDDNESRRGGRGANRARPEAAPAPAQRQAVPQAVPSPNVAQNNERRDDARRGGDDFRGRDGGGRGGRDADPGRRIPGPQAGDNRGGRDFDGRRDFNRDRDFSRNRDFARDRDFSRDRNFNRDRDFNRGDFRRGDRSFHYRGRDYAAVRAAPFRYPRGWNYRPWYRGQHLPSLFIAAPFFFDYDWLGLPPPPYGTRWVRFGPDAILVDVYDGSIVDVIYGVFY